MSCGSDESPIPKSPQSEKMLELLALLKAHDWTYEMADDRTGSVYRRGSAERDEILKRIDSLAMAGAAYAYASRLPEEFGLRASFMRQVQRALETKKP